MSEEKRMEDNKNNEVSNKMYNNLHLNLESEEEPPRRTYRKESMYLVS